MAVPLPRLPAARYTAAGPTAAGSAGQPAPITVVCVDSYPLVRLGVAYLASRYPDIRLIGEAETANEARSLITQTHPDVVVIGDGEPEQGRALATDLRAAQPRLGLVAVSHRTDDPGLRPVRETGLSAFVGRSAPATALAEAIRHAAAAPARFQTFGVPRTIGHGTGHARGLSKRERQVLTLIGDGLSNDEIASTLQVGIGSVRTYVSRLYEKLHVGNRSQALVAAAGNQLVGSGYRQ